MPFLAEHLPVLAREVVEIARLSPGDVVIDATVGLGGHSLALAASEPKIKLIGIDRDSEALEIARKKLEKSGCEFSLLHSNFSEIATVLEKSAVRGADVILADLGVSSMQLDRAERGFSFQEDAPLDMRMDREGSLRTAAELLAEEPEEAIADIIYRFGEETRSRRIAREIVRKRKAGSPVKTTRELATLIASIFPKKRWRIHPATRTFQALRIAVNDELNSISKFLEAAAKILSPGGRILIISFHSLEDRIIKNFFKCKSGVCICENKMF
ncbi:MAG TPA: 16S rRNA (cytosine(1402)-N(4))-methyltransferase RsmH, partial [Pyrinomonadaceae bacterium]|nr:16S rRNA (cytosine(1402)-N(4))-methyltransferase RsmH [Pyrinomonadaceae bacterium]